MANPIIEYSYKIKLDINRDIWNWYEACNKTSYGVDWKQRVPEDLYKRVVGVPKDKAYGLLREYLQQKYIDDKSNIDNYIKHIEQEYADKFGSACEKLVEITGKPLYRPDFTVYLTTFPRAPYNYEEGSLFMMIGWANVIRNFMHEALHFQFIHYWVVKTPESAVAKLDDYSFNWLKESLTVVLDESLYPLIDKPDQGYEIHAPFRQKLHEFWNKDKNFDRLANYGLKILPEYCYS